MPSRFDTLQIIFMKKSLVGSNIMSCYQKNIMSCYENTLERTNKVLVLSRSNVRILVETSTVTRRENLLL
jgi:hypothetical protein